MVFTPIVWQWTSAIKVDIANISVTSVKYVSPLARFGPSREIDDGTWGPVKNEQLINEMMVHVGILAMQTKSKWY